MKSNNSLKFFLVVLSIAILTYICFFDVGAHVSALINKKVGKIPNVYDLRTGIDIRGGVDVKLYAVTNNGAVPSKNELESAKRVIESRLNTKNIFDRNVTIDESKGCIVVQIPLKQGETDFNPQKTIEDIGKTAYLTFREVDENKKDEKGNYLPTDKIVIDGSNVVSTGIDTDRNGSGFVVTLELNEDGKNKFSEATQRLLNKPIAIYMDDTLISAPRVSAHITDGHAIITGQRTREEAKELAELIKSGSLPFKLEAKYISTISPTLGENALEVSKKAGIVAFILVCLFMLSIYRLPGILAIIALIGHTVIQFLAISWLGITVTLPGIAGIILSIGMGVDANVIIFERIKEELRNGKTLKAAIDLGFNRAFKAVFDGNMTTLISAVVLYTFSSGAMQSFAYTLGIGVILSFLTAVTASRIMLRSVSDYDIAKHHWLYGV